MNPARLLLIFVSVLSGCLYAPPLQETEGANYSPVLRETSPNPTVEEHLVVAPSESMAFRIDSVEDLNVEDTLHVRWFLNAEPGDAPIDEHIHRSTGVLVRGTAWQVDVTPCAVTNTSRRTFYLEALLTDRAFDPSVEPKFRGVPEDALTVHLGWRVRIDDAAIAECSPLGVIQ